MGFLTVPQKPAGRRVMKHFKELEERSSNRKQRSGRMSKRIESKDHTVRRLRGQRKVLRRVAQAPVKGDQESDGEEKEETIHAKGFQESVHSERLEMRRKASHNFRCNSHMFYQQSLPVNSALRQIEKLEKRLDRVRTELEREKNKNLYLQAQLQPLQEARAEDKETGLIPVFMDEARFTTSPVDDTYACTVARRNALAVQVTAKFGNDTATTEAMQVFTGRKSLPNEVEDQGGFHFIRGVFGTRAFTV